MNIPGALDCPGAELVYRVPELAKSPDTLVVVNCAGRTRSIIGAQSLINAKLPNRVVALKNGTMGWHLAGFSLENGSQAMAPAPGSEALARARALAAGVAKRFGIRRIDRAALSRLASQAGTHHLSARRALPGGVRAGASARRGQRARRATRAGHGHLHGDAQCEGGAGRLGGRACCHDGVLVAADGVARGIRGRGRSTGGGSFCARPEGDGRSAGARFRHQHRVPERACPGCGVRDPLAARGPERKTRQGRHDRVHVTRWRVRPLCRGGPRPARQRPGEGCSPAARPPGARRDSLSKRGRRRCGSRTRTSTTSPTTARARWSRRCRTTWDWEVALMEKIGRDTDVRFVDYPE